MPGAARSPKGSNPAAGRPDRLRQDRLRNRPPKPGTNQRGNPQTTGRLEYGRSVGTSGTRRGCRTGQLTPDGNSSGCVVLLDVVEAGLARLQQQYAGHIERAGQVRDPLGGKYVSGHEFRRQRKGPHGGRRLHARHRPEPGAAPAEGENVGRATGRGWRRPTAGAGNLGARTRGHRRQAGPPDDAARVLAHRYAHQRQLAGHAQAPLAAVVARDGRKAKN